MRAKSFDNGLGYLGPGLYPDPSVRCAWLDALKVVSAFAVVMTHIASIGWQAQAPSADGWLVTSAYEIATRFAVPAFFMTTGALLLNPLRRLSTRKILRRYVPRTALLALLVSFLYSTLEFVLRGWTGWRNVVAGALDGPYFIWYLWVLVGLYILTPLFRLISEREDSLRYSLIVLGVFVMGKSTVGAMLPGSWLDIWFSNFILFGSGMEGVFYYLLGAWLISRRPTRAQSLVTIVVGAAALVIAIHLNYVSALEVGPDLYYVARDNLLIAFFSIGVFELFRLVGPSLEKCESVCGAVSSLGMGIYLIHPFIRLLMEELSVTSWAVEWLCFEPLLSVPVVSMLIWCASACLSTLFLFVERSVLSTSRSR